MAKVRFATIGSSAICERFLDALALVGEAELVGCYSRSLARAEEFGKKRGARLFFDDLEALASCEEVDAVYIASPNACHAEQAKAMIAGGKHVLVEKSFAANEREAAEVFELARARGVVALEAMRNIHVNTFEEIGRRVGGLGQVRLADFCFSKVTSRMAKFRAGERVPIFDPHNAAGALADMGVYCVAPAVALFGRPDDVRAVGIVEDVPGVEDEFNRIDLSGVITLGWGDKVASLTYGKLSDDHIRCQIQGEGATLTWDQVSCPEDLRLFSHEDKGMVFRMEAGEGEPIEARPPENDMVCEARHFVDAVLGTFDASPYEQITLDTLHVMDEARRQMGVVFPADVA